MGSQILSDREQQHFGACGKPAGTTADSRILVVKGSESFNGNAAPQSPRMKRQLRHEGSAVQVSRRRRCRNPASSLPPTQALL